MAENQSSEQVLQDSGTESNSDPTEALVSEHNHAVWVPEGQNGHVHSPFDQVNLVSQRN